MKRGALAYSMLRALFWLVAHLACRYSVRGGEHVPQTGPLLIVVNHLSWFDPMLLGVILRRRVWFFMKAEMFGWPVIGWLSRTTGQIPVHRGVGDRAALEQALAYLREGKAMVIFPEGTVERQEQMIPAHSGVAMLALRSGATVLPIAHMGTRRVLRTWRSWFPRVSVQIGTSYVPELPEGIARKAGLEVVTQDIMQRIAAMLPAEVRGVYRK
ncbi:MAG: lysophospholipid acyltransferase family protein [Ktedonobacteraceae bacterium]